MYSFEVTGFAELDYRFKTLGYSIEKIRLLVRNIEKDNRLQQIKYLRNNFFKEKDY